MGSVDKVLFLIYGLRSTRLSWLAVFRKREA